MKLLHRVGLQKRIMLYVSVGLLVIWAIFGYIGLQAIRQSTNMVFRERLLVAQKVASQIDDVLSHTLRELEETAASPAVNLGDDTLEPEKTVLRQLSHHWIVYHQFTTPCTVGLTDAQGVLIWVEPYDQAKDCPAPCRRMGMDISRRPDVFQARQTGRATLVESVVLGVASRPLVDLAIPIRDSQGNVAGFLTGELDLRHLSSRLAPFLATEEGGYLLELIDESGAVIASTQPQQAWMRSEHLGLIAPLMQARQPGVRIHSQPERTEASHVVAFAPSTLLPWGVVVEQEKDIALMLPHRLQRELLLSGLLALLAGLGLAWVTTRSVVQPVRTLMAASQRIARGDLDQPVGPLGEDEVGLLAQALDEMRAALRTSRTEIERWNRELEERVAHRTRELSALHQASRALTSTLDLDALFQIVITETQEIFPQADAGALFLYDPSEQCLMVQASFGFQPAPLAQVRLSAGEATAGQVFQTARPLFISSAEGTAIDETMTPENRAHFVQAAPGSFRPWEAMGVPLISKEVAIGCLVVYSLTRPGALPASDLQVLQSLANHAAAAIENARLYREASMAGTLRELNRLKSEFVARASHELRTPLTAVKSLAETLLRPDLTLEPATQRELLESIDRACDRLAGIIDSLLTLSRIEAGQLEIRRTSISVADCIRQVVRRFHAQTVGQHLVVDLPGNLPPALADPDRLEDVLSNLLSNAIKYSGPQTTITVSAHVGQPGPGGQATAEGQWLVVSVADEGIGIPSHELNGLFQRFHRLDNAVTRQTPGVGLGLYICKTYVEAMGGRIWAESEVGRGSTFRFSLPIVAGEPEEPPVTEVMAEGLAVLPGLSDTSTTLSTSLKTVLVVDDEPEVLKTAELNLTASGFRTLTAASGSECLALVQQEKPDLIVLDILMPGLDGLEVAGRLKAQPATADIPIVFLTAMTQERDEARGWEAGAAAYIKKPFSPLELCHVVTMLLRGDLHEDGEVVAAGSRCKEEGAVR